MELKKELPIGVVVMGVPKQDIILAFHVPVVRQFTGFGTSEMFAGTGVVAQNQ